MFLHSLLHMKYVLFVWQNEKLVSAKMKFSAKFLICVLIFLKENHTFVFPLNQTLTTVLFILYINSFVLL